MTRAIVYLALVSRPVPLFPNLHFPPKLFAANHLKSPPNNPKRFKMSTKSSPAKPASAAKAPKAAAAPKPVKEKKTAPRAAPTHPSWLEMIKASHWAIP